MQWQLWQTLVSSLMPLTFCLNVAVCSSHCPSDGINYYVVALARRSSGDLSLLEMHERSSCHPGIRTTVGWTVPIGFLVNTSQISVDEQCNFPHGERSNIIYLLACYNFCLKNVYYLLLYGYISHLYIL